MNLRETTIGIIGNGTVGRATARAYVEHVKEVRVFDILPQKGTHFNPRHTLRCDIIFVCLPEGEIDGFFNMVRARIEGPIPEGGWCSRNFVLKSTVPIGTTRRLREQYGLVNLVHSPEFLTERYALHDAQNPSQLIIGFPGKVSGQPGRPYCLLNELYHARFPHAPIRLMSSDESEATKLFLNAFFAVKVSFFNEINSLASALGLDWDVILQGMLGDGRICPSHTQVPGPDGQYGFGGKCLPKDLYQLIRHLETVEIGEMVGEGMGQAQITNAARIRNIADRKRQ